MTKQRILFYSSLIFVVGVNLYFRSFPINFPQLKTQARDIIERSIQQSAIMDVQKKFPQFYPTAKDEIVRARLAEYKKQNNEIIKNQTRELYRQLKDRYQDERGQTYLMELDCWHWARYVENVVRHGYPGDELIAGRQWDYFMLAPLGSFLPWDHLLYYISSFIYKVFSVFKDARLFCFLFYLPLLFTGVFIAALFVFSFQHGKYIAGIISCLFTGLSPIFLPRSCAGWFDMDVLNLLFPLLIMWTYLISGVSVSFKRSLLWNCLSCILVGLFCFTWTHWWFIFLFIVLYELISIACLGAGRLYFKKDNLYLLRRHLFSVSLFISLSLLCIFILAGREPLVMLVNQMREALALNKPLIATIWPNVFFTVGELRRTSLLEIGRLAGGTLVFALSVICLFVLLARALFLKAYSDFKRNSIIIIAIWFISMVFAASRGVRFVVFLLMPLGVSLGWAMNDMYEYFRERKHAMGVAIVAIAFIAVSAEFIGRGSNAAKGIFPLMDDTWYRVLNLVKEKTPPETIINSWWDFGDWFKVVSKRRVIFDGQSSFTPQAYWMAKALLTDNENEAVSILRMVNNGGNRAFEIIDEHLKDPLLSVLLLENALLATEEKKRDALQKFLPAGVIENVIKILTHNPARADFVVDHTMPYKIPAISYLGNWNFSKVYIAQNFDSREKDKIIDYLKNLGRDGQTIQRFYQEAFLIPAKKRDEWLSRRLQFYGPAAGGREKDGLVFFDNGFAYNISERKIQSNSGQVPRSAFVAEDGNITETIYPNANVAFSVLIFKAEDGYKSIFLDHELGRSIFVRLYFLNGRGLKHFLPFVDAQEGNNYIRVFDIIW